MKSALPIQLIERVVFVYDAPSREQLMAKCGVEIRPGDVLVGTSVDRHPQVMRLWMCFYGLGLSILTYALPNGASSGEIEPVSFAFEIEQAGFLLLRPPGNIEITQFEELRKVSPHKFAGSFLSLATNGKIENADQPLNLFATLLEVAKYTSVQLSKEVDCTATQQLDISSLGDLFSKKQQGQSSNLTTPVSDIWTSNTSSKPKKSSLTQLLGSWSDAEQEMTSPPVTSVLTEPVVPSVNAPAAAPAAAPAPAPVAAAAVAAAPAAPASPSPVVTSAEPPKPQVAATSPPPTSNSLNAILSAWGGDEEEETSTTWNSAEPVSSETITVVQPEQKDSPSSLPTEPESKPALTLDALLSDLDQETFGPAAVAPAMFSADTTSAAGGNATETLPPVPSETRLPTAPESPAIPASINSTKEIESSGQVIAAPAVVPPTASRKYYKPSADIVKDLPVLLSQLERQMKLNADQLLLHANNNQKALLDLQTSLAKEASQQITQLVKAITDRLSDLTSLLAEETEAARQELSQNAVACRTQLQDRTSMLKLTSEQECGTHTARIRSLAEKLAADLQTLTAKIEEQSKRDISIDLASGERLPPSQERFDDLMRVLAESFQFRVQQIVQQIEHSTSSDIKELEELITRLDAELAGPSDEEQLDEGTELSKAELGLKRLQVQILEELATSLQQHCDKKSIDKNTFLNRCREIFDAGKTSFQTSREAGFSSLRKTADEKLNKLKAIYKEEESSLRIRSETTRDRISSATQNIFEIVSDTKQVPLDADPQYLMESRMKGVASELFDRFTERCQERSQRLEEVATTVIGETKSELDTQMNQSRQRSQSAVDKVRAALSDAVMDINTSQEAFRAELGLQES